MKKILLFKSASEDYKEVFAEKNYEVIFVDPLQFTFINVPELNKKLHQNYDGLILTSPRAAEALSKCWSPSKFVLWNSKKTYTVGDASRQKIALYLGLEAIGATSGNAENLAKFIIENNSKSSQFFFPCGNLRSETLPNLLQAAEYAVDALTVYETKENEKLRQELIDVNNLNGDISCAVFFSPSGCEYVYRQLQTLTHKLSCIPHFAIGHSTASKIENFGVEVAGVPTQPRADCLLEAVQKYFAAL